MKKATKLSKNISTKSNSLSTVLINNIIDILSDTIPDDTIEEIKEILEDNKGSIQKLIKEHTDCSTKDTIKKAKDPNAPKRGKSSYIFFCMDNRASVKADNPEMKAKDIIKELGTLWRNLSEEDKAPYIEQSKKDKLRYEKEIKDYIAPDIDQTQKQKKKFSGPKRSLTSYIYYCKEHREKIKEQNPDMSPKEITSLLGKQWRSLDEKGKKPYNKLAKKDKERYEKEKSKL